MSKEPDYDDYDKEEVFKALKDAGLEKKDLDVIESALEALQNNSYLVQSILDDHPDHDTPEEFIDVGKEISDTLDKIRRGIDVAYPPANRLDNKEKGIGVE